MTQDVAHLIFWVVSKLLIAVLGIYVGARLVPLKLSPQLQPMYLYRISFVSLGGLTLDRFCYRAVVSPGQFGWLEGADSLADVTIFSLCMVAAYNRAWRVK